MSNDKGIDTRPADVRAQANGPWLAGNAIDRDAMDDAMRRPPAGERPMSIPRDFVSQVVFAETQQCRDMIDRVCGIRRSDLGDLGKAIKEAEEAALSLPATPERFVVTDYGLRIEDSKTGRKYIAIDRYEGLLRQHEDALDQIRDLRYQVDHSGERGGKAMQTIAQLRAEVESLSRQLRSREINRDDVSEPKPPFRWSPLL